MDLLQRAVPAPQAEVAVHRAARWQVLWNVAPLAAGAQHTHHAVDHFAHVDGTLATATLGGWYKRPDQPPFRIGEIARITQLVAVIAMAVFHRPHQAPRGLVPATNHTRSSRFKHSVHPDRQPIQMTHKVAGRTLRVHPSITPNRLCEAVEQARFSIGYRSLYRSVRRRHRKVQFRYKTQERRFARRVWLQRPIVPVR